jgi:hypothetical protein
MIVGPEGIKIRGVDGLNSLTIPWSNIERIRLKGNGEFLLLREPLETRSAKNLPYWAGVRYMGARFFDDEQLQYIAERRWVGLQPFAFWIRHGDMGDQIARYAPALADGMQAQRAEYQKSQAAYNRTLKMVLLVSLAIFAGTIAFAAYAANQPPEKKAIIAEGEHALDKMIVWGFSLSLTAYAILNLRASARLLMQKHFGLAAFWFLFAVIQVLLVFAMWGK